MLGFFVSALAFCLARGRLLRSLPRLKWLFLSILLVYGWTVPGQYLWQGWLSPTDTGLLLGLEQVMRLLIVTSSLQVLLMQMTKHEIFMSIYIFLTPLQYFNQLQSRFALRFALTLETAEDLLEKKNNFKDLLSLVLKTQPQILTEYTFQYIALNVFQRCLFATQCILILLTISIGLGGFWN